MNKSTASVLLVLGLTVAVFFAWKRSRQHPELAGFPEPSHFEAPLAAALSRSLQEVKEHPENATAWGRLGMLCQAHELYGAARQAYRLAADGDPQDDRWPHLLGIVCQFLALSSEADRALSRAVALRPTDLVALSSLARIREERGEDEKARNLYERALKIDPHWVAAVVGIGQLALRARDYDTAEKNLTSALDSLPDCRPAHAALALLYTRRGESERADFHRRWSWPASGKLPLPDPLMDQVLAMGVSYSGRMKRGHIAAAGQRWQEAVENFQAASRLERNRAEPRFYLGVSLLRAGNVERGLAELRQAAALPGREVDSRLRMAPVLADRREFKEAHKIVEQALRLEPENADALVTRAGLYAREKNHKLALADLEQVISLHPQHAVAHLNLGRLFLTPGSPKNELFDRPELLKRERERAQKALAAFDRALQLKADLPDAYEGSGLCRLQLGDYARDPGEKYRHSQAAIKQLSRLVKYFSERKSAHVWLIRALYKGGKIRESLEAVHRAHELWPDDPLFQKAPTAKTPRE